MLAVILTLGIFSTLALSIAAALLRHYEQPAGSWLLLALASGCFTSGSYFGFSTAEGTWLLTCAMGLLCLVALVKYWEIMQLTQ